MPKRKQQASSSNGGTGYGGQQGDTKKLLAGRKKAEKLASKEDSDRIVYLNSAKAKLEKSLAEANEVDPIDQLIGQEEREAIAKSLADIFRNQVPTDWDSRKDLYNTAFDLCTTLSSDARLGAIFGEKDDQESVLFWLIDFSDQAEQIMKRGASADVVVWSEDDAKDLMLATRVQEVKDAAVNVAKLCQKKKPVEDLSVVSLTERYQSQLGSLRFDTVDSLANHFFLRQIPSAPSGLNTRVLFKELAAYKAALPVEYGSSCFCRVIDSRLDMLRVLITGPDDTPYANGLFLFDVNLPANYPQVAPKVQYLTTGGGRMRFNPNLYQCGKVCLSLLGTWQGPGWIPNESTLLQVLISIQSLILVPDPYFNEPGWERERNTPRGATNSERYNLQIRRYTVDAAIETHLLSILNGTNPYKEFEHVMVKHILEKRSLIEKELRKWSGEDPSLSTKVANICSLMSQLARRESDAKKQASRAKRAAALSAMSSASAAASSNEPIVLDSDDDDDDCNYSKGSSAKENATIQIDIGDDGEDDQGAKKPAAKLGEGDQTVEGEERSSVAPGGGDGGVIDLT